MVACKLSTRAQGGNQLPGAAQKCRSLNSTTSQIRNGCLLDVSRRPGERSVSNEAELAESGKPSGDPSPQPDSKAGESLLSFEVFGGNRLVFHEQASYEELLALLRQQSRPLRSNPLAKKLAESWPAQLR